MMPSHGNSYRRLAGAIALALLLAGAVAAQSTTSSRTIPRGRSRVGSAPSVRSTPSVSSRPSAAPSSSGGSSYSGNYQRSYSGYELNRQRQRYLYGSGYGYRANPYGTRWCATFVPRLSSHTKPSFVSITTLAAPKAARAGYKKAAKQMNKRNPDSDLAMEHLQEAVSIYPDYAAAWTLLGRVQYRAGDRESAEQSLQRALEIDPQFLGAYSPMARIAVQDKRWDELLRLSEQMLRINPVFTLGHYNKGGALLKQGDTAAAEKALREALSTPDAELFPESHYMLGSLYHVQRDVQLAAREYRIYAASAPPGPTTEQAWRWVQLWEQRGVIEPVSGKKKKKR